MIERKNIIIGITIMVVIILFIPMIPIEVTYQEVEPYEREAKYQIIDASLSKGWDFIRGDYTIFEVVIKNIDKFGGTFIVTHYLYTIDGLFGKKTISEYIGPGETTTFRTEFDTKFGVDVRGKYQVTPPIVVDKRVVTKHRTVYKSIIELILYGSQ
jgi:hypothetical protein